jgi:hypothetical protein
MVSFAMIDIFFNVCNLQFRSYRVTLRSIVISFASYVITIHDNALHINDLANFPKIFSIILTCRSSWRI